jgi:hypothetical protein
MNLRLATRRRPTEADSSTSSPDRHFWKSGATTADADWHETALLQTAVWMLLGLPVMYALVAAGHLLWTWLFGAIGWFAVLAMPGPASLTFAVGFGVYVRLPQRAWAIHRSRVDQVRFIVPPPDHTGGGLAL